MGDYEKTITVAVSPQRLFSYLADVQNLPQYLPRMTAAEPRGGDRVEVTAEIAPEGEAEREVTGEAWIRVIEDGSTLEWGAPGPHDYHGRLSVGPGGDSAHSTLTVDLSTERVEGEQIDHGLAETLRGIKSAVEGAEGARG